MFSLRSFALLALATLARAQFGSNDEGGFLDASVAACTEGEAPPCAAYMQVAATCYDLAVASGESAGISCVCAESARSAFDSCAQCVLQHAGVDAQSTGIMSGYKEEIDMYCTNPAEGEASSSQEVQSDFSTTSLSSSSTSSSFSASVLPASSSSSSALVSSATPGSNATNTTADSSVPTGAGTRRLVGVLGWLMAANSAMVLLA